MDCDAILVITFKVVFLNFVVGKSVKFKFAHFYIIIGREELSNMAKGTEGMEASQKREHNLRFCLCLGKFLTDFQNSFSSKSL